METPASAWQQARLVEVALARTQMHCYALEGIAVSEVTALQRQADASAEKSN